MRLPWTLNHYLLHNSWITSAQHVLCKRITADMQAHNSCCAAGECYNPDDRH